MKRTIYLLAFLWAFLGHLNAQFNMEVKFGETEKWSLPNQAFKLESGQFLYVKTKIGFSGKVFFDLLDEQMNLIKSEESNVIYKNKFGEGKLFRSVESWGGKLYLFYSINKDVYSYKVFAEEIDQSTLKLSGDPILIGDFEKKGWQDFGWMRITRSNDGKRMILYLRENVKMESERKTEHIQLVMLDEALQVIWQKSLLKPAPTKRSVYLDVAVNNAGEAFVLEQLTAGERDKKKGTDPDYSYILHKFDNRGAKRLARDLELGDRKTLRLDLGMTLDEDLLVNGIFNDEANGNGIVYMRLNTLALKEQVIAFNHFDIEYITQGYSKEKGEALNLPITVREWIPRPDGGLLLLGERFKTRSTSSSTGAPSTSFSFGEIFIIKLDAKGDIVWNKKIMKKQKFSESLSRSSPLLGRFKYASFCWAIQDGNIILLFNDNRSNVAFDKDIKEVKMTPYNLDSYLNAVRIDENGDMEREQMFKSADYKVAIYPACSRPLNKQRSEFVLIGINKNKQRLAHLKIN